MGNNTCHESWVICSCKILIFQIFIDIYFSACRSFHRLTSLSKWCAETRLGWRLMRRLSFQWNSTNSEDVFSAGKLDNPFINSILASGCENFRESKIGKRVNNKGCSKRYEIKKISTIIIIIDLFGETRSVDNRRCYSRKDCKRYLVAIWTSPSFLISSRLQKSPTIHQKLV